jgi:hypothetical protein
MASGGLRGTFLSSYTELDARQNAQIRYNTRHWLYTMLPTGLCFVLNQDTHFAKLWFVCRLVRLGNVHGCIELPIY